MRTKGIVLAGGSGSRLWPATRAVSKQLLPVFDKPLIYYPLSVLLLAGIRDILIITTPQDQHLFERLLGTGDHLGVSISYEVQQQPKGIAQALTIGRDFIGTSSVMLVLGDNILHGAGLQDLLIRTTRRTEGATIFAFRVDSPRYYGVIEFDSASRPLSIEEKPTRPK